MHRGQADAAQAPLSGVAGFVVRYVSHSPAPIFALSAVPLLAAVPALRAAAAVVGLVLVLFALRGGPDAGGPLPLAFDLALALLAGLALDAQWRARREPLGRRVRSLALVAALFAAAALSVATTVTGPLAPELQAPVGLLAMALVLHFALAGSRDTGLRPRLPAAARRVVPAAAARAPGLGRGARPRRELAQPTPTRAALDRAMGERARRAAAVARARRGPRPARATWRGPTWRACPGTATPTATTRWCPGPAAALGGMRPDGTASRELLETDPGRLELLGVRFVQVPTDALAVPGDADGLGEPLDVVLEPPRPHLFALPITRATEVRLLSFLAGAVEVEQGMIVAECVARLASGREIWLPIRAGVDTAEWAWDRPDLRRRVRHARPRVHASFTTRPGRDGQPVPRRAAAAGPLRGPLAALPGRAGRPAAAPGAGRALRRRDRRAPRASRPPRRS